MELTINGEKKDLPGPLTVAGLLAHLQLPTDRVAVEVNRAVVPRRDHATRTLGAGVEVELVTFVGGG
jgi:thiamine biosynthesis protein ThiS